MSQPKPLIKLYQGFATNRVTTLFGHVLESVSDQREHVTHNPIKNALEMYRRYNVKPVRNEEVVLEIGGKAYSTTAGKKGFFRFELFNLQPTEVTEFKVRLKRFPQEVCTDKVTLFNPGEIIVSDIDDTVLISHATNLLKKLYLLLTKNHQTRKAFEGIREFYDELHSKERNSKFFYVSSSEWNLYDFLQDFVQFNSLPDGVFLLQDIKSGLRDLLKSGGGSHLHKKDKIKNLLWSYPDSKFVLVGDSGQHDPYIYSSIAMEHPGRVKKIYIRDVRSSRRARVNAIIRELADSDVEMEIFSRP